MILVLQYHAVASYALTSNAYLPSVAGYCNRQTTAALLPPCNLRAWQPTCLTRRFFLLPDEAGVAGNGGGDEKYGGNDVA